MKILEDDSSTPLEDLQNKFVVCPHCKTEVIKKKKKRKRKEKKKKIKEKIKNKKKKERKKERNICGSRARATPLCASLFRSCFISKQK